MVEGPTLKQFIDYLQSLQDQFGEDAIINIKSAIGFNEEGAMIIDDDSPAIMAAEEMVGDKKQLILFIMAAELQKTFEDMMAKSAEDEKSESSILDSSGENYSKEKKLIT